MYNLSLAGEMTDEEFANEFQEQLLSYFEDTTTANSTRGANILSQIFSDQTSQVGMLNQDSPTSNHQVDVLESLASGNYTLDIDEGVLETGFAPKAAICMANISASMYEYPHQAEAWIRGLGLDLVETFPAAGDLSARGAVLADKKQNAVIVALKAFLILRHTFRGEYLVGFVRFSLQANHLTFLAPPQHQTQIQPPCVMP